MDDYLNHVFNEDCMTGLDRIPDHSVDLVVMDPPYELETTGAGAFGNDHREYHSELTPISEGISDEVLEKICSKMKNINIYIWCNKTQILQYLNFFDKKGCNMDILTWHKTNPTPTCGNKYLSDTEYVLFFREPGVKVYGSYNTKKKWYVSGLNTKDKKVYNHPTIKPMEFIRNMVINAIPDDKEDSRIVVMDPFLGSGTTAAVAKELGQDYIGFEIDPVYYQTAIERIDAVETVGVEVFRPTVVVPKVEKKFVTLSNWGM